MRSYVELTPTGLTWGIEHLPRCPSTVEQNEDAEYVKRSHESVVTAERHLLDIFDEATDTFERNFILRALEKCRWNVTATAEYLGIPLSTLKYKMDKLDVRDTAAVEAMAKSVGAVDILLNAAGFVHHGTVLDCSDADFDFSFDLNVIFPAFIVSVSESSYFTHEFWPVAVDRTIEAAGEALRAREVEHNLMLGIAGDVNALEQLMPMQFRSLDAEQLLGGG